MIVRPGHPMQASIVLLALALGVAVIGCTEKLVEPPPPQVVLGVPDSIQQIFTANCALPQCHAGPTPQQGQDLSDAVTSYNLIVGVASHEKPAILRIAPGDSANSYMVMKLRGTQGAGGGQPMPLGAFPLDPALVIKIAAWAQQGAGGVPVTAARPSHNAIAAR